MEGTRYHEEVAVLNSSRDLDSAPLPPLISAAEASSHSEPSTKLLQEQIQHNYQEFEEKARRKAAKTTYYMDDVAGFDGLLSPLDEVDRDFERVFLEQSGDEAWASDADDSSE